MPDNFFDLIRQGGLSLIPLAVCSILVIAVTLERWWTYSKIKSLSSDILNKVSDLINNGNQPEAVKILNSVDSPYARILQSPLEINAKKSAAISDCMTMACDDEVANMASPLWILGTIGNIAPFIGLFGTVLGIMRAFHEIRNQASAGANAVSGGVAEALIATAIGLGIGMVAVVANNWCTSWVERYRMKLERFATEWSSKLEDLASE
jgi:biopolymer transport protein ExbB